MNGRTLRAGGLIRHSVGRVATLAAGGLVAAIGGGASAPAIVAAMAAALGSPLPAGLLGCLATAHPGAGQPWPGGPAGDQPGWAEGAPAVS